MTSPTDSASPNAVRQEERNATVNTETDSDHTAEDLRRRYAENEERKNNLIQRLELLRDKRERICNEYPGLEKAVFQRRLHSVDRGVSGPMPFLDFDQRAISIIDQLDSQIAEVGRLVQQETVELKFIRATAQSEGIELSVQDASRPNALEVEHSSASASTTSKSQCVPEVLIEAKPPFLGSATEFSIIGSQVRIRFEGKETYIKNSKGAKYLSHLLYNPGKEFEKPSALEISVFGATEICEKHERALKSIRQTPERQPEQELSFMVAGRRSTSKSGKAGEIDKVKEALTSMKAELEEAKKNNDIGNAERLNKLISSTFDQLRDGGHLKELKKYSDSEDQARKRISAAIHSAIGEVRKNHPQLAQHLEANLVPVKFPCKYAPIPEIKWPCST